MRRTRRATEPKGDAAVLKTLTRPHGEAAVAALALLAEGAQSESVKLAAIKELLDRGFGRAGVAPVEGAAGVIAHLLVDDGYEN